jgi:hypothetical protein
MDVSSAVLNTYLFKNKHTLGISFMYESDYSVAFESDEYFFVETFGSMQKLGHVLVYIKTEDGKIGDRVDTNRVLNLIRLDV